MFATVRTCCDSAERRKAKDMSKERAKSYITLCYFIPVSIILCSYQNVIYVNLMLFNYQIKCSCGNIVVYIMKFYQLMSENLNQWLNTLLFWIWCVHTLSTYCTLLTPENADTMCPSCQLVQIYVVFFFSREFPTYVEKMRFCHIGL
jgi:hypothetical protein